MNELALFAGAGGGILGGKLLGWRTICAVERDEYAASVLVARQNDGILAPFPVWSDVCTFDGTLWRGRVDVISGGFPCQDISRAGRMAGISGAQSGLWVEFARIIRETAPRWVFLENTSNITHRGLGTILRDLASMGYNARWGVLGADACGGAHTRKRMWLVANARGRRCSQASQRQVRTRGHITHHGSGWEAEPNMVRVADGVAGRVDRVRCLGNGQVPAVAALAWRVLREGLT